MYFCAINLGNHVVDGETGAAFKVSSLLFICFIYFQQTHYSVALEYNRSPSFANFLQSLCKYFLKPFKQCLNAI